MPNKLVLVKVGHDCYVDTEVESSRLANLLDWHRIIGSLLVSTLSLVRGLAMRLSLVTGPNSQETECPPHSRDVVLSDHLAC